MLRSIMKKLPKTVNLNLEYRAKFIILIKNKKKKEVKKVNFIDELPEDARKIPNTLNWVDRRGNVYGIETRKVPNRFHQEKLTKVKGYGKYFKMSSKVNSHNGYVYCCLKFIIDKEQGKYEKRTCRVHRLVAEIFLENPNNYDIVGHRNNIKNDNRVENLYWTTSSENTQKAVDDGLLVNDKSYEDSQSKPVYMFDTYTNQLLGKYGSCHEASRITGLSLTTILRQAKYKKPVRKPFYFRFQDDESVEPPVVVVQYDFQSDQEIQRFINTGEASRQTGICQKVISQECQENRKPKRTKSGFYFLFKKIEL